MTAYLTLERSNDVPDMTEAKKTLVTLLEEAAAIKSGGTFDRDAAKRLLGSLCGRWEKVRGGEDLSLRGVMGEMVGLMMG